MKTKSSLLLTLPLLLAAGASTTFGQVTGNPASDGWTSDGLSTASGNLLFETGNFSVNMYATAFNLAAGSPLLGTVGTSEGWSVGDTIVGVGGVFTPTGNSSVTYDNANGTVTTRFVVKYGTSTAAWTAGSAAGAAAALGGTGAIELGTSTEVLSPTSGLQIPSNTPEEITGPSSTATISDDVGQILTSWTGTAPAPASTIVGFESFLDLTLLDSQVPSANVALGDDYVLDLQQQSGALQDSTAALPGSVAAVPEPSMLLTGSLILLPFGSKLRKMLRK
jgi:hypothetical protein